MNHITQAHADLLAKEVGVQLFYTPVQNVNLCNAAIQHYLDAQNASGWQDISTAPQENQRVLVWCESGRLELTSFWHGEFISSSSSQPTHWMPLPAAPQGDSKPMMLSDILKATL